jgi:hypothetical protein
MLKGFENIGDSTITNHTIENLVAYFDYGLLEKSNFIDVQIPTTGVYGGLDHKLVPVDDPRFDSGQVWESARKNWVWESGFGVDASGVYIDGDFYDVDTTGNYSHHINFPLGRVVLDSGIPLTSDVQCEYSYKWINVTRCVGKEWITQIHNNSERSDSSNFLANSGEWNQLADNRYQLPAIGIEYVPDRSMRGYQIGGGQWVKTKVLFHCVAEDEYTRNSLVDIINLQNETEFKGFNLNSISDANGFPLDYGGVPASGAKTFPELVSAYPGTNIRMFEAGIDSIYSLNTNIHVGTVKITTESVIFGV